MKKISFLTILMTTALFGCMENPDFTQELINAGAPVFKGSSTVRISVTASYIEISAEIEKENGATISERGFCYGTSANPTVENSSKAVVAASGVGVYQAKIEGLSSNTTYYVRPYAINSKGVEYGDELQISTNTGLGFVKTTPPTGIHAASAMSGGEITDKGEGTIISRGVFVSVNKDFIPQDTVYSADDADLFTCRITNLTPSQKYYIQAFVFNNFGYFTGNIDSLVTRDGLAVVSKADTSNLGYTGVTVLASVTNGGDETVEILERGFSWQKAKPEPVIDVDSVVKCGAGQGGFNASLTGLEAQKEYFVRPYAITQYGIVYGAQISFSTKTDVPTVTTEKDRTVANGSAVIKGRIVSSGMTPIADAGICWSTSNQLPTISDSSLGGLTVNAGGVFTGTMASLKGGLTYYVRAYARNSNGISYGDTIHFKTPDVFIPLAAFPGASRSQYSTAYFSVGNKLYILGGDIGSTPTDELWMYSVSENKWYQRQSFRGGAAKWQTAVVYGTGVYVFGGIDGSGNRVPGLYLYETNETNPSYNTWSAPETALDTMYMTVGYASGGFLYFVGGFSADTAKCDVWSFNAVFKTWQKLSDFPVKQYGGFAVVLNGLPYVGMGKNDANTCNGKIWTTSDNGVTWSEKTTCTVYSGGILAAAAYNQKIYLIDENFKILEYDPVADTWSVKSTLASVYQKINCMFEYNGLIYIGLGTNNALVSYDPTWDN
ncbi:MAG: hypothetical protein LBR18_03415 [Tannerella sp.]|jgi:hypothetical protein|nr:hypothetical protein [Tannerella sp.]